MAPATLIVDVKTEKVVKVIHELGGMDEVWYNPGSHRYYTASRDQPGGPEMRQSGGGPCRANAGWQAATPVADPRSHELRLEYPELQ